MCVCLCEFMCTKCVSGDHRDQKRVSGFLELELHWRWAAWHGPVSSGRTLSALTHCAIIQAPNIGVLISLTFSVVFFNSWFHWFLFPLSKPWVFYPPALKTKQKWKQNILFRDTYMWKCLQGPGEGISFPRAGVAGGCSLPEVLGTKVGSSWRPGRALNH